VWLIEAASNGYLLTPWGISSQGYLLIWLMRKSDRTCFELLTVVQKNATLSSNVNAIELS
jgi:hypothetical protein